MKIWSKLCNYSWYRTFVERRALEVGFVKRPNPNCYFDCTKREINPKVFLDEDHIRNCKMVSRREELLKFVPVGGVTAEVGVATGYFSELMLNICKPRKHYMIEYSHEYAENLRIKFAKKIEEGVVELLEGDSAEMIPHMPDGIIDFVYLDATHDYEHPKKELELVMSKMKLDGIIAGHDYTRFSMWEAAQFGVVEAVNEFAINHGYEMAYYTLDMLQSNSSYGLKKCEIQ